MFASIFVFAVSTLFFSVGAEDITKLPHDHEARNCLLPPHPEHGRYTVRDYPKGSPGARYFSVTLDISCDKGYRSNNSIESVSCINGDWSAPMPTCAMDRLGHCTLSTEDPTVAYYCLSFVGTRKRSRECASPVPSGTMVIPLCQFPYYFSRGVLPEMHCRNGTWDYQPICEPACGLTTQHRQLEGESGEPVNHLELPWHAEIYKKTSEGYSHTCGGSLVTETKIISAARCFHDNNVVLYPASDLKVAVNKMYDEYKDTRDRNSQYSDVTDIKIPSNYQGYTTNYEHDIAVVIVKTPFSFHKSVRPVCLDFDRTQLTEGNSGKAVRWSEHWSDRDQRYEVLVSYEVLDYKYVKNEDCLNMLLTDYHPYLTEDKFCARNDIDEWGDLIPYGNGFVFLDPISQRYYLRGVASDSALDTNYKMMVIYTSIMKHEDFIKQHL